MFYEQLQKICKEKGKSLSSVLKQLNISTGNTGNWKKGTYPTGDKLLDIANNLDVSIDYLLTGEYKNNISEDEAEILEVYRSLSPHRQGRLLQQALDLQKENEEQIARKSEAV